MVQEFGWQNIKNERDDVGFIDLTKNLLDFVKGYGFVSEGNLLASQNDIQQKSYLFCEQLFSAEGKFIWCGKQMQLYLAKIDLTEISNGIVDLSSPDRQNQNYSSEQTANILKENNMALGYLKNPFSSKLLSEEFSKQLGELNAQIKTAPKENLSEFINEFMNLNKKHLDEVILFCEALGLICNSQSLYAFSYQLSVNANFAKLIELVLKAENYINHDVGSIKKLADKFFSIFVGNIAARVFSEQTLSVVEKALSVEVAKYE